MREIYMDRETKKRKKIGDSKIKYTESFVRIMERSVIERDISSIYTETGGVCKHWEGKKDRNKEESGLRRLLMEEEDSKR